MPPQCGEGNRYGYAFGKRACVALPKHATFNNCLRRIT